MNVQKNLMAFLILSLGSTISFAQSSSEPRPIGSHPGFEAFKKNVYPITHGTKDNPGQCVKCHNTMGPGPGHSSDDPWTSYQMVLPYVNFQNLKYSKFVSKGLNGHGNAYGGQVTLTEIEMINLLNRWWTEGENQAFLKDKKILKAQKLPPLPATGEYVTMTWPLDSISNSLKGMQFKIDIQRFIEAEGNHAGANRFKNPRVETNGQMVKVQGIYFIVNGNPDTSANDFVSINNTTQYVGTISFLQQIVLDTEGPTQDQIAIAFDNISLGTKDDTPQFVIVESEEAPKAAPVISPKVSDVQIKEGKSLEAFNEAVMGISAHFVKVRPGEFDMGSPEDAPMKGTDETLHRVRLTKAFEIQATEVTQVQWYLLMGTTPSLVQYKQSCDEGNYYEIPNTNLKMCAFHPVENVSWSETQSFIQKLNTIQTQYVYRLPTEAEWEYVAHGGLPAEYAFGYGSELDGQYTWYQGNSNNHTHQVATRLPIPAPSDPQDFVYDMGGNVWQWNQDQFDYSYPPTNEVAIDPTGARSGNVNHPARGGAYTENDRFIRAAARLGLSDSRYFQVGFRLVRTPTNLPSDMQK